MITEALTLADVTHFTFNGPFFSVYALNTFFFFFFYLLRVSFPRFIVFHMKEIKLQTERAYVCILNEKCGGGYQPISTNEYVSDNRSFLSFPTFDHFVAVNSKIFNKLIKSLFQI